MLQKFAAVQMVDVHVPTPDGRALQLTRYTLKAHVGEWGTADDVQRAVEVLELDEVQHGISAAAAELDQIRHWGLED